MLRQYFSLSEVCGKYQTSAAVCTACSGKERWEKSVLALLISDNKVYGCAEASTEVEELVAVGGRGCCQNHRAATT